MKTALQWVTFLVWFLTTIPAYASGHVYYVTQNGSGLRSGSNLSNAWSVADFNDPKNWSATDSAGKIDPGDTVYFKGTIGTQLSPQGSGTSGRYIVLDGKEASLNVDASSINSTSGSINVESLSYLRIQNFSIDGQRHPADAYDARAGIWLEGNASGKACTHIVIDRCSISNHSAGVMAYENVHHVTLTRSYIKNVRGNGFGATAKPVSNMTIGGSMGNGNTFQNCGYNTDQDRSGSSPDIELGRCPDSIISYNHAYADRPYFGMGGIMIEESERILIEYNTVHGHYAVWNRGGIVIKEDRPYFVNEDIIVRFNHVYDELQEGKPKAWGGERAGIHAGSDVHNVFIYGNYVHDTHWGIRLMENFSGPDGRNNENFYVFANVVANTEEQGIAVNGSQEAFINLYIFNNTIYRASYSTPFLEDKPFKCAIGKQGMTAAQLTNVHIKNNVILDSRPNESDRISTYWEVDTDSFVDYNHYYSSTGSPAVCAESKTYNLSRFPTLTTPYGNHYSVGDPLLTAPSKGAFMISSSKSPLIDSGTEVGKDLIGTVTIRGEKYAIRWDTALDPVNTDWSVLPPSVSVVQQSDHGSWERGAYAYPATGSDGSNDIISAPQNLRPYE